MAFHGGGTVALVAAFGVALGALAHGPTREWIGQCGAALVHGVAVVLRSRF